MTDRSSHGGGALKSEISQWIVDAVLAGENEVGILAGVCERMSDAGLALVRASVANDLLDPTHDGRGVRWRRGEGALEEIFVRVDDALPNEAWTRSPFFVLLESRQPMFRRRLNANHSRGEIPLLDEFQDDGVTDYLAFAVSVPDDVRLGTGRGIVASWTTDAPDGFTEEEIGLLAGIMPALTVAFMLRTTQSQCAHADFDVSGRGRGEPGACGEHRARAGRADPCGGLVQRPGRVHADLRHGARRIRAGTSQRLRRGYRSRPSRPTAGTC